MHVLVTCRFLALLVALLPLPGLGQAATARDAGPSFDCSRAGTQVERWICDSPRLAVLDAVLGRYYPALARSLEPGPRRCLGSSQAQWLDRRNHCDSPACVEQVYLERLGELEGLLPGAVLDRRLEDHPAPPVPRLLALLPADGSNPAPAPGPLLRVQGTPVEAEGGYLLVDTGFDPRAWAEFAGLLGDADALRGRFGEAGAPVAGTVGGFSGLDLDGQAGAAIQAVAAAGGRLQLSGYLAPAEAPGAIPQPDPARCAYVHALP